MKHAHPRTARAAAAVLGAAVLAWLSTPAAAAGPWRGQVVDDETGEPLSDVVVLAIFVRTGPGVVHNTQDFHDVDEVVTDAEGRFEIPSRIKLTWRPFTSVDGPELHLLKHGYGQWKFAGLSVLEERDTVVATRLIREQWRRFEREGVVLRLVPARTSEEQLRARRARSLPVGVPPCRIPRWWKAYDAESQALGISPSRACP